MKQIPWASSAVCGERQTLRKQFNSRKLHLRSGEKVATVHIKGMWGDWPTDFCP